MTEAICERWGILAGEAKLRGRTLPVSDGLIASTALVHGLVLVRRNTKDFKDLGVSLLNLWEENR